MVDPSTLLPIISGVISAAVNIGIAIQKFWQVQKDRRRQNAAFQASHPTSHAATELHSLMDVQGQYWPMNPAMWQALGHEAAGIDFY